MNYRHLDQDAALIVVDMQEDFCEPHGALAVERGRELATGINRLLELPFKLKIATQDYHPADHCSFASQHDDAKPFVSSHTIENPDATGSDVESQTTTLWPDHCVQGTRGVELIPELDVSKISHIVKKGEDRRVESYSAFGPPFRQPAVGMSGLEDILENADIRRVFVCGLAYDFCVKHTALDAKAAGFDTFIVVDLTQPVNAESTGQVRSEVLDRGVQTLLMADLLE